MGRGAPCFIIAEAGVNHNGDLGLALGLVDAAAEVQVDAVKFQAFRAENVVTAMAVQAEYQSRNTGAKESQLEMVRRLELSEAQFDQVRERCRQRGILFLCTPFDEASVEYLERSGVPAYKIGSGELTNLPFLDYVARKGRPMLISTGMADLVEVGEAVQSVRRAGNNDIALLHCVSNYPADPATVNLHAMAAMEKEFGLPVGFSDHTLGDEVALAAVALGACIVEKHFTLDRGLPGPDHLASIESAELKALVNGIRKVESALGDGIKRASPTESNTAQVARRSLVAARDLPAGTVLTLDAVSIKRPGTGLAPSMRDSLVGRRLRSDVAKDDLFAMDMFV